MLPQNPRVQLRLKILRLVCIGLLSISPEGVFAQYIIQSQVVAGGGARITGGSYSVTQTIAQNGPIGISSGGSYATNHGFWYTTRGDGGSLSPMVLNIERLSTTTARLSWTAINGATYYDLYRSTTPYFTASGSPWQTLAHPAVQYSFTDGIGNTSLNYFFIGKARNASQISSESNIVGEFDFGTTNLKSGIVPGPEDSGPVSNAR